MSTPAGPTPSRTVTRPVLLSAIRLPSPPPNAVDESVVIPLVAAYQRRDPVPPPVVFEIPGGLFELLSGQHRMEAAKRAGFAELMCTVLDKEPTPLEKIALQYRENAHRKKLTIVERADLFASAMEAGNLNGKAVAKLFDTSESSVSRALQVNSRLVDPLKELVAKLQLIPRLAYQLSRLEPADQVPFYEQHKALPTDQFEAKISEFQDAKGKPAKKPPVQVDLPGLRVTLQHDLAAAIQSAKSLWQTLRALADKSLPMTDLPAALRMQG